MSLAADPLDRDLTADDDRPARRPRGAKSAARADTADSHKARRRSPRAAPLSWRLAFKVMLWGTLIAAAVTLVGLARHGHAPSWRSIAMLGMNALPLAPGLLAVWLGGLWLGRLGLSRLLTTALVILATLGTMALLPALAFGLWMRMSPGGPEDVELVETVLEHLWLTLSLGGLYMASGFRLWWPFGAVLPAFIGLLHWRARR